MDLCFLTRVNIVTLQYNLRFCKLYEWWVSILTRNWHLKVKLLNILCSRLREYGQWTISGQHFRSLGKGGAESLAGRGALLDKLILLTIVTHLPPNPEKVWWLWIFYPKAISFRFWRSTFNTALTLTLDPGRNGIKSCTQCTDVNVTNWALLHIWKTYILKPFPFSLPCGPNNKQTSKFMNRNTANAGTYVEKRPWAWIKRKVQASFIYPGYSQILYSFFDGHL